MWGPNSRRIGFVPTLVPTIFPGVGTATVASAVFVSIMNIVKGHFGTNVCEYRDQVHCMNKLRNNLAPVFFYEST